MKQTVNYINIEDFTAEYKILESYINRKYQTKLNVSDRIWVPIIETHIKAILDERIFTLFRTFDDGWETSLLDVFLNGLLGPEDVENISRSRVFASLNRAIKSAITPIMENHDPNFTIWDVAIYDQSATISACGDYRIEQWHKEHQVTKLNVTDSLAMDVYYIFDHIRNVLNQPHAPAKIGRSQMAKARYFDNIINLILTSTLKKGTRTKDAVHQALDELQYLGLINDSVVTYQRIKVYLDYELVAKIDKINTGRIITGFVICGQTIIVNFGGRSHFTKDVKTFQELELESAIANGDYVPERLRK